MTVIDVNEADFEAEVVQRSAEVPVVVDFWAPWCGPCRQLGPVLEKAAAAREGDVVLAKVDTDENPAIANRFGIQGIPAVKAFRDGEVVAEFVGAQGPSQVEAFFDGLVPSETQLLLDAGDEASLRKVLEREPATSRRTSASPRCSTAAATPTPRSSGCATPQAASGPTGSPRGSSWSAPNGEHPRLADAFAKLDAGDHEGGLEGLLAELSAAEGDDKERLRKAIVAVLDELGVDHPLARDARRRLAQALY
jgi:putative thioredoxin